MDSSSQEEKKKQKITKVKTLSVPFPLREIKENITITTFDPSNTSKEEIINQAFKFHSQGNILEAEKLYQYLINQGIKDYRIFSNYGNILNDLDKLQDAEFAYRKAIEINPDLADLYSNLGNVLRSLGKIKEARLCSEKTISLRSWSIVGSYTLDYEI